MKERRNDTMMIPTQIIFLVGAVLFGFALIGSVVSLIAYVLRSRTKIQALGDDLSNYRLHWYNTLWIWVFLIIDAFFFFLLYMDQYLGQGILFTILWSRWIFLAAIALFNSYCLAYVMTYEGRDPFAVILVVSQVMAYLFLWFGAWSDTVPKRALWLVASGVVFLVSMLVYVWPFNKWTVKDSPYHKDIDGQPWGAYYHRVFYVSLGVLYVAYFIIWVLSETNGLTDVMSYEAETASLMVFEVAWFYIFAIYLIITMSTHMVHTLSITDTRTNQVTFDASATAQQQPRLTSRFTTLLGARRQMK